MSMYVLRFVAATAVALLLVVFAQGFTPRAHAVDFATFDPDALPLVDYPGEMKWYLDVFFDRREGGIEVIGGMHKWTVPANRQFAAENFGRVAFPVG